MKKELDCHAVLKSIKRVLPVDRKNIELQEPQFSGREWACVKECLDTCWVSSTGEYVDKFEEQLAVFTGIKNVIAVVNGTAALHICLKLAGVRPGDEVLIPTLTFVATANAVVYCMATSHFVDSEEKTLGLDPHKLADYLKEIIVFRSEGCFNKHTGRRIRAVVPMHTFGHPVDLDPLVELCKHFKIELVEDAAESLGSYYKKKHTGSWGRASALSFNGNKIITTGGGGALLTNDDSLAKLAKHLTTTAKLKHQWGFYHDQTGFNYRMPNLNAALGYAQLEQLPSFLVKKRALADRYQEAFAGSDGVRIFQEPRDACSNYWLNVLLLNKEQSRYRDTLLNLTRANGIMTRPVWTLLHKLPMYRSCPRMNVDTAESLEARLINLPSSVFL
jgi:perosamine synthetase